MKNSFYITTTLPYVNAPLHMGHALEFVRADTIARYKKLLGFDVYFNTGTDEHGMKIYEKAASVGQDIKEFVDESFLKFKQSVKIFGMDEEILHFVRTTDEHHIKAAQEFWKKVNANGYIYKKSYQTKYCVGCESEKTDSELDEKGGCPLHPGKKLELINEENYFFKFSEFGDKLLKFYEDNPNFVIPDFRLNEMKNFIKARQCYDNVLEIAPLNNDARNNLLFIAETVEKNGMDNEAISIYRSFRDYEFDAGNLYRFAIVYEKIGKIDSALIVLDNLISQYPDYFNGYAKIGEIYGWKLNEPDKAVYYLKKAISMQPANASVAEAIGSAYEKNKEYENAIIYLKKALSMEPSNVSYRNKLAKAYKLSGNNDKANLILKK